MIKLKGGKPKINNNSKQEFYKFGSKLGLNKKDIENIFAEKPKNDSLIIPFNKPKNALDASVS